MTDVSGNRPPVLDHRRKLAGRTKAVGLAVINYLPDQYDGKRYAVCSCGWQMGHIREKVLEDGIDRHLSKKHGGRGIRL